LTVDTRTFTCDLVAFQTTILNINTPKTARRCRGSKSS
jgi:hypothetical protein